MADVFVLGAGVVGMTSAYALACKGYAVTVIDAGPAPAEAGASFGNGGQLSYCYTDALASPSLIRSLPKYMIGLDPASRLRLTASPQFWTWVFALLANSSWDKFEANTIDALKLALESRDGFEEIAGRHDFDHSRTGKLTLYASPDAMRVAMRVSRVKNAYGAGQMPLSPAEAIELEPALSNYGHRFVSALWSPLDEAGDSRRFCHSLQQTLQRDYGVRFRFGTKVEALVARRGKLAAIRTSHDEFDCRRAVLALGVASRDLAGLLGIKLPIWPMQGYSLTVAATERAPAVSVTDTARKVVFCRLGGRLRIAGLADIGRRDASFKEGRFGTLLREARGIFPEAADYDGELQAWTGLRPMTPDSRPIIAQSQVEGLFLNCGHGALGWTLSMGSALRLASLLADDP